MNFPILEVEKSVCVLAKYMATWRAWLQIEVLANYVDDIIDSDSFCLTTNDFTNNALCQVQIDFFIVNGRVGHDGNDNTFQVTHAFINILSNIVDYFRREL